ncbi:MAG TPA: class E sortase [Pseudonocardiaceae bacterium]|nr:class E sortase [Pseudonocardiaceae bacterium]
MDGRLAPREHQSLPPPVGTAPARSPEYRLVGQALVMVPVLVLSFLIELALLGNLRHDRDQAQLAAQFRLELARGIAPVGPIDEANTVLALGAPVALLEIPKLGLREVVVEGTSSGTLMSGPGHRRDTPLPGQVGTSVVAGRRATYGGPFRSVDQLGAGDVIIVTTGQGRNSFAVIGVRHAGNPLPPALPPTGSRLTLVTADGPAFRPVDVLRVDAALTGAAQSRPAQLPSQTMSAAEAVMAGDRSALLGAFGWLVLLVAVAIAVVWLRFRAGPWPAWLIGVPVLITLGLTVADEIAALLPNLL